MANTQQKLGGVRPPRVHITYDVEIGDAIEMKELPFVLGVLGDYSGMPAEPLPNLKKNRKFVNIDRDNFNDVLKGMNPRLAYRVDNQLAKDGTKLPVELKFNHIDDFTPERVTKQIKPMRELLGIRDKLADLRNKIGGNDKLEELLQDVLQNTEKLTALGRETGFQAKPALANEESAS